MHWLGIFTRLGCEAEDIGIENHYSLAKRVLSAIEEARPLLSKVGCASLGLYV